MRQMQMIAETEKYVNCEHRAYAAEQQLAAVQSNNVQLQVCIDKLRMKYEPGMATLLAQVSLELLDRFCVISL